MLRNDSATKQTKKNPATINQSYQSCLTQIHDSKAFSKPCNSLSFNWELAILSKIITHCHLFRVWLDSHLGPTLPMEILLHLMEIDVKEGLQENRGLKIELSYTYSVGNFGMTRSWWSLFSYQKLLTMYHSSIIHVTSSKRQKVFICCWSLMYSWSYSW